MNTRRLIAVITSALLLAACASPATRIKAHPDIYARATPEQQSMISRGQIALGFPPDFVRLALGEPDRITQHIDQKGTETIWHYVEFTTNGYTYAYYGGYPFYTPYGPYIGGPFGFGPTFVEAPREEKDRLRVIFKDDKVTSIEQVLKG